MSKTVENPEEQRTLVERVVRQHQPQDYKLVVREAWYSEDAGAWIVAVDVDRDDVSAMDFARKLVEIEDFVHEGSHKDVRLRPAMWRPD